jgi:hypothetical protein
MVFKLGYDDTWPHLPTLLVSGKSASADMPATVIRAGVKVKRKDAGRN